MQAATIGGRKDDILGILMNIYYHLAIWDILKYHYWLA